MLTCNFGRSKRPPTGATESKQRILSYLDVIRQSEGGMARVGFGAMNLACNSNGRLSGPTLPCWTCRFPELPSAESGRSNAHRVDPAL